MGALATTKVTERGTAFLDARTLLDGKQFRQAIFQAVKRTTREGRTDVRDEVKKRANLVQKYITRVISSRMTVESPEAPEGKIVVDHEGLPMIAYSPKATKRGGVTVTYTKGGKPIKFGHAFKATMKSGHVGIFTRQKLAVFTASTKAEDLMKAGFPESEARGLLGGHEIRSVVDNRVLGVAGPKPWASEFFGKGIRHMKRIAFGGNFPDVTPKGIAWRLPVKELNAPPVTAIASLQTVSDQVEERLDERFEKNLRSQIDRFTK